MKKQTEDKLAKYAHVKLDIVNEREYEVLPTGIKELDEITGTGGLPFGRIYEIYGPESVAKTTLTLQIIAQAQKEGHTCAFVDMEHAFHKEYSADLGVDKNKLDIYQPDYGEQALQIAQDLIDSGTKIVVVDSVAALSPKAEIEGDVEQRHVGAMARMMGQALRKLVPAVSKNNAILIFTNQLRSSISSMGMGLQEFTPGGKALKYYASIRLELKKMKSNAGIKNGQIAYSLIRLKATKNKVGLPYREATLLFTLGKGFIGEKKSGK